MASKSFNEFYADLQRKIREPLLGWSQEMYDQGVNLDDIDWHDYPWGIFGQVSYCVRRYSGQFIFRVTEDGLEAYYNGVGGRDKTVVKGYYLIQEALRNPYLSHLQQGGDAVARLVLPKDGNGRLLWDSVESPEESLHGNGIGIFLPGVTKLTEKVLEDGKSLDRYQKLRHITNREKVTHKQQLMEYANSPDCIPEVLAVFLDQALEKELCFSDEEQSILLRAANLKSWPRVQSWGKGPNGAAPSDNYRTQIARQAKNNDEQLETALKRLPRICQPAAEHFKLCFRRHNYGVIYEPSLDEAAPEGIAHKWVLGEC